MPQRPRIRRLTKSRLAVALTCVLFIVIAGYVGQSRFRAIASGVTRSPQPTAASAANERPLLRRFRGTNRHIGYGSPLERSLRPISTLHDAIWPLNPLAFL